MEPQSRTPKRRHTLGAEPKRPLLQPQARPSLPATRQKPITYRHHVRPQQRLESSESESSEEESLLKLPALRTRPSTGTPRSGSVPQQRLSALKGSGTGTPRSGPTPQQRHPAVTEPRPARRASSAAREAIRRDAQSSPSHLPQSRHGPRQTPSQFESESSDHEEVVPSPKSAPRITSMRSSRGFAAWQRLSLGEASSSANENAQNASLEHPPADHSSLSDGLPDDTQASLADTQPETLAPRTTVVARARRGRGGWRRGTSRPLSAVTERTESIENRMDRSAPTGSEGASQSSGAIGEAAEAEESAEEHVHGVEEQAPTPRPTQSSRLREIARKVMGV